ncbi:MAG: acyl-CoA dehydrogenase family protein [Thermoplasmata archaeon]
MLDYSFSDEQELLRQTAREFCEREISPKIKQMMHDRKMPQSIWKAMAKMNFLGMNVPEEYGGMGADPISTAIVAEEISRADPTASIPVLFLVDNAWSYLVSKYGTTALKEELLPKVVKGERIVGIASTEPNYGSDIGSMKSYAIEKKGNYLATGEKAYISLVRDIAEIGGGFVTVLKTDRTKKTDGVSLFYMPYDKSFDVTYLEEMGREGSSWAAFSFKDVSIPKEYMLGNLNGGFKIIHEGFEFARGLISVISAGAAIKSLENGVQYMKERDAFGKPIVKFQGLQFQLADHVARMEAARTIAYKALWMYSAEQKSGRFTRFQVSKEIAIAKLLTTTWAFDAINDALQWQGAFGYSKECPEEWALRGIRSFQLAEGSREIMKVIIARETVGKENM